MARGLVVAAPASGMGKTTVAVGLMAALTSRGEVVQPFKVGPDFIDAGLHRLATGRPSYNLDGWMVPEKGVKGLFSRAMGGATSAIVEGAMGLFDSAPGDPMAGSTAQIAAWLKLPVVLVVDCSHQAGSVAALVHGFATFHPHVRIPMVILNRVGSARHARLLEDALSSIEGVELVGMIPRDPECRTPSRHLGLVTAQDLPSPSYWVERLRQLIASHVDMDRLLAGMAEVPEGGHGVRQPAKGTGAGGPVVAVAQDEAFCFYYQENLDLLVQAGATVIPFSPLRDRDLPPETKMIYLGGGYPELHAEALASNRAMMEAIRAAHRAGIFIYGECGGMIYLGQRIRLRDGREIPMCGILPVAFAMEGRFQALGYRQVETVEETPFGPVGIVLRGHEFHYSRIVAQEGGTAPFESSAPFQDQDCHRGVKTGNTLAGYCHLHLGSNPEVASHIVDFLRRI